MENNNFSRIKCKEISVLKNWKKDGPRNVLEINGEKWSFSVFSNTPECRQTYSDTVGFVGYHKPTGKMMKYRVKNLSDFSVSRITSNGIKAFNVILKDEAVAEQI